MAAIYLPLFHFFGKSGFAIAVIIANHLRHVRFCRVADRFKRRGLEYSQPQHDFGHPNCRAGKCLLAVFRSADNGGPIRNGACVRRAVRLERKRGVAS